MKSQAMLVQRAAELISKNLRHKLTIKDLSVRLMVSEKTLLRAFKNVSNMSGSQYIRSVRIDHAKQLLQKGHNVKEAGNQSGYTYVSNFTIAFKDITGMTPTNWLRNNNRTFNDDDDNLNMLS